MGSKADAETIARLKSEKTGLKRSLTNLRKRTWELIDYLEGNEGKFQTKALREFRNQIKNVKRLLR